MPPEIGVPVLLVLVSFWILYRIERKPTYLPPPVTDERDTLSAWWRNWRT